METSTALLLPPEERGKTPFSPLIVASYAANQVCNGAGVEAPLPEHDIWLPPSYHKAQAIAETEAALDKELDSIVALPAGSLVRSKPYEWLTSKFGKALAAGATVLGFAVSVTPAIASSAQHRPGIERRVAADSGMAPHPKHKKLSKIHNTPAKISPASLSLPADVIHNPVLYDGEPFACPDPDLSQTLDKKHYLLVCTSDKSQKNPILGEPGYARSDNAFPIYESVGNNLNYWVFKNFIFPTGHYPAESVPPQAPYGHDWSSELHYDSVTHKWLDYFAAMINPTVFQNEYHQTIPLGRMGIYVAETDNPLSGNWQSHLLHWTGQFNGAPGNSPEYGGGVIDPTVALNPQTGDLDMAWALQSSEIFIGKLSPDGLSMQGDVHLAVATNQAWECKATAEGPSCCVEGPVLEPDPVHSGLEDLFFNADSTWAFGGDSYKVGVAVSADPDHTKWTVDPEPVETSASGPLQSSGIGSQPVPGPDGGLVMAEHFMIPGLSRPHFEMDRFLGFVKVSYNADAQQITASADMANDNPQTDADTSGNTITLPVPNINGNGQPSSVLNLGQLNN